MRVSDWSNEIRKTPASRLFTLTVNKEEYNDLAYAREFHLRSARKYTNLLLIEQGAEAYHHKLRELDPDAFNIFDKVSESYRHKREEYEEHTWMDYNALMVMIFSLAEHYGVRLPNPATVQVVHEQSSMILHYNRFYPKTNGHGTESCQFHIPEEAQHYVAFDQQLRSHDFASRDVLLNRTVRKWSLQPGSQLAVLGQNTVTAAAALPVLERSEGSIADAIAARLKQHVLASANGLRDHLKKAGARQRHPLWARSVTLATLVLPAPVAWQWQNSSLGSLGVWKGLYWVCQAIAAGAKSVFFFCRPPLQSILRCKLKAAISKLGPVRAFRRRRIVPLQTATLKPARAGLPREP